MSGYDVIHTRDLPQQNKTMDSEINAISMQQERMVVTKNRDFLDSFLLRQQPYKLFLVTTFWSRRATLRILNCLSYLRRTCHNWLICLSKIL